MTDYKSILNQLRNGELQSVVIKKEEFLQFREQLIKDEQFKISVARPNKAGMLCTHFRKTQERSKDWKLNNIFL